MRYWLRGKKGGLGAYLVISALVLGGLGWVTAAALRLEQEQAASRARNEIYDKLRLALWRLDSRMAPLFAKEDSRPYNHYSAIYAPALALRDDGRSWPAGTVLEPSPLLNAELPDWMLLHFQTDGSSWSSPQVLSDTLARRLGSAKPEISLTNVTPARQRLLADLGAHLTAASCVALVRKHGEQPTLADITVLPSPNTGINALDSMQGQQQANAGQAESQKAEIVDREYLNRAVQTQQLRQLAKGMPQNNEANIALDNTIRNGENWLLPNAKKQMASEQLAVALGPMIPLWLGLGDDQERLLLARIVQIGPKQICQGIILDWQRLRGLLIKEVDDDLFPGAELHPVRQDVPPHPERTMTALPLELDPGSLDAAIPLRPWTPLRFGLVLAWMAALTALVAVGLGGWSLLDLSERRFRFVSAVTHELRTPLTTLRLYLDMLTGGMIKEEAHKTEYLQTLNSETERLNRLVGNVLDFSRLENQRPRLVRQETRLSDLLEEVRSTWQGRCLGAGKELVLENPLGDIVLFTDAQMLQQILGNLIDNACKYSKAAQDQRIWLRSSRVGRQLLSLEVEDRGPGVPTRQRRAIFRPFRRGEEADVTAGGVGLGLALAKRWSALLGGRLSLQPGPNSEGACFRLELPLVPR